MLHSVPRVRIFFAPFALLVNLTMGFGPSCSCVLRGISFVGQHVFAGDAGVLPLCLAKVWLEESLTELISLSLLASGFPAPLQFSVHLCLHVMEFGKDFFFPALVSLGGRLVSVSWANR
mmetsp:Transcript_45061/g.59755  ORF Transcript_45061/g.59755 Transcript_45061/m.59755 type:complete len:119 (-) Transcript_45061:285-641(-)